MVNRSCTAPKLEAIIKTIEARRAAGVADRQIVDHLVAENGGRTGFSCGAYTLSILGVRTSCTHGHDALLNRWIKHARRAIAALEAITCEP